MTGDQQQLTARERLDLEGRILEDKRAGGEVEAEALEAGLREQDAGDAIGGGESLLGRAKTALRIACQLADANAGVAADAARRPPEDASEVLLNVERNKMVAQQQQEAAGVAKLTRAVRGK